MLFQEPWLNELQARNVQITSSVYFGSVKLQSKHSVTPDRSLSSTTDGNGKTISLDFPKEKFIFDDMDLSQYDVEQEMGAYPFAIIQVEYQDVVATNGDTQTETRMLGWARIKLYQHRSDVNGRSSANESQWVVLDGKSSNRLFSGNMPEGLMSSEASTPPTTSHSKCQSSDLPHRPLLWEKKMFF